MDGQVVDAGTAGQAQFGVQLGGFARGLMGVFGDELAVAFAASEVAPQLAAAHPCVAADLAAIGGGEVD